MSQLRFDNKVVIVTGAGGGLGRAYATFFASRGASVVVNDLGTSHTGEGGTSSKAADVVVNEIVKNGGKAVANYDSVEDGDKIVETALKAFGKIDIVLNNAGILRDKSFSRMSDSDWDLIHRVHVRGSYKVAKAAWEHMTKQGFGRIINTASAAGIYGNFGQVNYSAAKLALHGFTLSLAREGARKNIHCNTIAPLAASRMTETVLPPDMLASLKPDFIVPVVAYLCHESCKENGSLFEAGAGFVAKLRFERSRGHVFKADPSFTPGAVAHSWKQITSFKDPEYPESLMDTNWVGLLDQAKSISSNPSVGDLRFDGKVALVTGAGGGLGRAYSLLLAKLGASVVVNDLGGSHSGVGNSSSAADKVVQEIIAFGGKAVANYDSVEDGDKLVETAIKAFGRIDILVNNAGILRDKSFARMTDADWDLVHKVHLRGMFKVTKAAWPYMNKQKYGRIINTASAVGLYGNFGQANYSAAKLGTVAFSNALALEGKRNNILVNTIAPNAGTRMTATVMPPEMVEALKPDYVATLVGFLAHEANGETGSVFEVGSGWVAKVRWQRTGGVGFPVNQPLLPEHIAQRFRDICNFNDGRATYPTSTQDSFNAVQSNFDNKAGSAAEKPKSGGSLDVESVKNLRFAENTFTYTERDTILYALGVGAKRTDLDLVYEGSSNFFALPTFGVVPMFSNAMEIPYGDFLPKFNPMMLLHGEQYLEIKKPFPTSGTLKSKGKVVDILDKGKGAVVIVGITTTDTKGDIVCYNEMTTFIRGSGGFGGKSTGADRGAATAQNDPPKRNPDTVIQEKTSTDQAALYRLSGDYNPLHIDPSMSAIGGFDVPILHGLCTFGYAGKHILKAYCGNDPDKFKSIKARFASHVFPGETIETKMWKEGNKVIFQVRIVERDVIAISNAAVEIAGSSSSPAVEAGNSSKVGGVDVAGFGSSKIFAGVEASLQDEANRKAQLSSVKALFQFDISNGKDKQTWFVDLKKSGTVGVGKPSAKPDLLVTVADSDFVDIASGKINAQKAFMSGKIKVKGNMALAIQKDPYQLPNLAVKKYWDDIMEYSKKDELEKNQTLLKQIKKKLKKSNTHDEFLVEVKNLLSRAILIDREQGDILPICFATEVIEFYLDLNLEDKILFLSVMAEEFGYNLKQIEEFNKEFEKTFKKFPSSKKPSKSLYNEIKLQKKLLTPKYDYLLQEIKNLPGGKKFIVDMRADLLTFLNRQNLISNEAILNILEENEPSLRSLDDHLKALLQQWFGMVWLGLERISWNTPASILEKIAFYEAVHPIPSWKHLKQRIDGDNRRCFSLFHSALPGEPLTTTSVALMNEIPSNIHRILEEGLNEEENPFDLTTVATDSTVSLEKNFHTAVFYSITSSQKGLSGVDLGNFLIKRVVKELQSEIKKLETFVTLSPIPNFRNWVENELNFYFIKVNQNLTDPEYNLDYIFKHIYVGESEKRFFKAKFDLVTDKDIFFKLKEVLETSNFLIDKEMNQFIKPILLSLCARYVLAERKRNLALDPVANFHLRNGACVYAIHWMGDLSEKGINQSFGIMINYNYVLSNIERNNQMYLLDGIVSVVQPSPSDIYFNKVRQTLQCESKLNFVHLPGKYSKL
ncbi:hypothetical protein HDU92_009152 [Lobulomyces angularis]|nr:hypothetical protein HDU92_009152 [Lobulomyces angularis]